MQMVESKVALISRWMARVGGFVLLAAAILIVVEVVLRATPWGTWSIGTELGSYALAIAATWSLAHVVLERSHVRVDFIVNRLSPFQRGALDVVALGSLAAVGMLLSFGAGGMLENSLILDAHSNTTLGVPLALPQGAWLLGLIWFSLVAVFRTIQAAIALAHRDYSETSRIGGAPSADDEVDDAVCQTDNRLVSQE